MLTVVLVHQSLLELVKTHLWRYHGANRAWRDVMICHITSFFMQPEDSLLSSQVSQFSNLNHMNPVPTLPSSFRVLKAAMLLPLCKTWKLYRSWCVVFPSFSENHLNCFVFIYSDVYCTKTLMHFFHVLWPNNLVISSLHSEYPVPHLQLLF